jgi:26 proteasome complex subunit DSS1
MSAAPAGGSTETTKAIVPDSSSSPALKDSQKTSAPLEEDDEFEDFPVDDWSHEEAEVPGEGANTHLWEESWDDDDMSEDFSKQLKQELEKVKNDK